MNANSDNKNYGVNQVSSWTPSVRAVSNLIGFFIASNAMNECLVGKFGKESRAWKGETAGYVAKHLWIVKHYGNATHCSVDKNHKSKRFEWHNISGEYKRDMSDWEQMCTPCHRRLHKGNHCKHGHEFNEENTYICKNGWRHCRACQRKATRKWLNAQ